MSGDFPSNAEVIIPLHKYLHKRVSEIPGMTNVSVAKALDYKAPNVVAMLLNGSMKVPIVKVPALADVLGLDRLGLLRRVLMEYMPEVWQTLQEVIGRRLLITEREASLLEHTRAHLGGEDLSLLDDRNFRAGLTKLLFAALDRAARHALATGRDDRTPRDSKIQKANTAMLELLQEQARQRAALLRETEADKEP